MGDTDGYDDFLLPTSKTTLTQIAAEKYPQAEVLGIGMWQQSQLTTIPDFAPDLSPTQPQW